MKYKIVRSAYAKGWMFLYSVYKGDAYVSTHKWDGSPQVTLEFLAIYLQKEHDRQVDLFINKTKSSRAHTIADTPENNN